jgi:hypothetical protein
MSSHPQNKNLLSEDFEFRHFRPHYLDVDTLFDDLRRECLHQRVVRNNIFRKAPPSIVSVMENDR